MTDTPAPDIAAARYREALQSIVDRGTDSPILEIAMTALSLPPSKAEEQVTALLELLKASDAFCPGGVVLTGESELMGEFKKKLQACKEAGL